LIAYATKEDIYLSNVNDNSILLPTNDVCFEKLMDNPKVRKGLSAALLEIDPKMIKDTTLLKNKTERSSIDDKYGILDVKILLVNGTIINLEMQIRKYDYWDKRILFYMSKSYASQIHMGEEYEKLKKSIHASILDFVHFPKDDRCYRKIMFCDVDTGEIYTDVFSRIKKEEIEKFQYKIIRNKVYELWKVLGKYNCLLDGTRFQKAHYRISEEWLSQTKDGKTTWYIRNEISS